MRALEPSQRVDQSPLSWAVGGHSNWMAPAGQGGGGGPRRHARRAHNQPPVVRNKCLLLKPLSLWDFVIAARTNEDTSLSPCHSFVEKLGSFFLSRHPVFWIWQTTNLWCVNLCNVYVSVDFVMQKRKRTQK